ncbi:MAG: hypothetical protein MUF49_22015 [Oculatellaceae cyanobacterium Prado106]|nr:hypothetical protein [Oculatellaceae cyanobacterium Prado106]
MTLLASTPTSSRLLAQPSLSLGCIFNLNPLPMYPIRLDKPCLPTDQGCGGRQRLAKAGGASFVRSRFKRLIAGLDVLSLGDASSPPQVID